MNTGAAQATVPDSIEAIARVVRENMHYVIGSGPAGVACARALLRKRVEVTLIDPGLQLENSRRQAIAHLQSIPPAEWRGEQTRFLRDGMSAGIEGVPLKMAYGSDFPYRPVAQATELALHATSLAASYARGGFSNVWGAAVLPYRQRDLVSWPFGVERLEKHYRSIFDFVPLSARKDDLEEEFPLYTENYEPLAMSRQARSMLSDLEKHRERLHSRGISFGAARLAVAARRNGHDCARCGLCMYGCPYHLIYASGATLDELSQYENFRYLPGFRVTRIEENAARIQLSAQPVRGGSPQLFEGERVYLACGVLATTALLLRSMEQYDCSVPAIDSKYFLLPILRFHATAGVRKEPLHTLAQLFLEINDPGLSPYTIHLQTYTYNDLFEDALRSRLGPLAAIAASDALVSRLLLLQGYLHSSHSPKIWMELRRKENGEDVLHVSARTNPESDRLVRGLGRKLARACTETGALPLLPLLRLAAPGRGFHTGGTFPMRNHPQDKEADLFGRPAGFSRVHAVDASVFPSVPATTITLTVMANAHRIADELEQYA